MNYFAERFKALRKSKGFSQAEIAEILGVKQAAVSKWEKDATLPPITTLEEIARVLETDVNYLLGQEEIPTPKISKLEQSLREKGLFEKANSLTPEQRDAILTILKQMKEESD